MKAAVLTGFRGDECPSLEPARRENRSPSIMKQYMKELLYLENGRDSFFRFLPFFIREDWS